jgi:hypothetical protein
MNDETATRKGGTVYDDSDWAHEMSDEPEPPDLENGPSSLDVPNSMNDLHDEATSVRIRNVYAELHEILVPPAAFSTDDEIRALTYDQAYDILIFVRRNLMMELLSQETHNHMTDDCGDYLSAASDAWHDLFEAYDLGWHDQAAFTRHVRDWLLSTDLGGCDGEPRYSLLSDSLMGSHLEADDNHSRKV